MASSFEVERGSPGDQFELALVCRVCLQGGGRKSDFVSLYDFDENDERLSDKYLFCSGVEVTEAEPLPTNICLTCADRLLVAYQFKLQCLTSYDTLKQCLRSEREDDVEFEYEVPIEAGQDDKQRKDKQQKRNRGRPRKYPDAYGHIEPSPYNRKKKIVSIYDDPKGVHTTLNEETGEQQVVPRSNSPFDDGEIADAGEDPDYVPKEDGGDESDDVLQLAIDPKSGSLVRVAKRSDDRNAKRKKKEPYEMLKLDGTAIKEEEEEDDILLKETLLASSAPIPGDLISSQSKDKKKTPKRIYKYDKVHTCHQCGSSFRSNASLQAHLRRHSGIKPYSCTLCSYSCVLNMELRRHMMRHTGLKPYKCRICDRYFGDFGSRQKHERLHLGQRPYSCTLCGKTFTYSYVLSNHMLTHTGEKKYSCAPCNKRFTKAHHLKYHNKTHHKDLYLQEQMMLDAKRMQHINISDLTTVCTEQLLGLNQDITSQEGNIQVQQVDGVVAVRPNVIKQESSSKLLNMSEEDSNMKENIQIIQHFNSDIIIKSEHERDDMM